MFISPQKGVSDDFWATIERDQALTAEERGILDTLAAERYKLGEDIVLCKKMLQLLEMAVKRRDAAIAAGRGTAKDLCGYDIRLDTVCVFHQFAAFLSSPEGEAIFRNSRLDAPTPGASDLPSDQGDVVDPLTGGMCIKKKCKPHAGWNAIMTKDVRHSIKQLTVEAKEKLGREGRVRDCAASRYKRKQTENNTVIVHAPGSEMDVDEP